MEYGIFTSKFIEIAQTKKWAICFCCNLDKSIIEAKLYKGIEEEKKLVAIVKKDFKKNIVLYAYQNLNGQIFTNDKIDIGSLIGSKYSYNVYNMKKNDFIEISKPYHMSTIEEKGLKFCLKQWRMGTFYQCWENDGGGMQFQMVTNKVEYVFMIINNKCDIYCSASINVPYEEGMICLKQYFRIRNYDDNSQQFCWNTCDLGNLIKLDKDIIIECKSNSCIMTKNGLIWPLKKYENNMIVLEGCGGSQYTFLKDNKNRCEYFLIDDV